MSVSSVDSVVRVIRVCDGEDFGEVRDEFFFVSWQ